MADSLAFHFQPKASILHRFDPRFKTLSLILFSPSIMMAGPIGLFIVSLIIVAAGVQAGLKWRLVAYELRYFGLLLLAMFISRAIFIPGKVMITIGPVHVTDLGMISGVLICWRLVLITAAGLIYATTTRPKEIRAAVQWLAAPVPGVPEKRLGVMIGLVVRLIPMVIDLARETIAVQKARCVECRKNPYYRLTRFTMPVMRKTIKLADHLVMAMMARCYSESATPPAMQIRLADWIVFALIVGLCLILIVSPIVGPIFPFSFRF